MPLPADIQDTVVPYGKHSTWARTFRCTPQYYFQPSTVSEIISIVNAARKAGKSIMTVGAGHSPSDLTFTNDWVVNLDKFNKVIAEKPSKDAKYTDLTVEAGIRVFQINKILASKGLAIQSLGSISQQSIAGIISTGTHGSSPYHGLVSQQIVDITLVNGLGKLVRCSSTENPTLFRAATLSLGKIGLIVYVTIRTVPSFNLRSTQEVISFDTLLDQFERIWTSNEFVRVWWFPYTERCILWRASKSTEPISNPRPSWYGTKLGRFFYETLLWISVHLFPRLTPYVEKFVFARQYGTKETYGHGDVAVQYSVDGLNMDCLFSQYVDEWAAPLTSGPEIIRSLRNSIEEARKTGDFFVHSPIEVRCSNTTCSNTSDLPDLTKRTPTSSGPIFGNQLKPLLDNTPKLKWAPQDKVTNSQLTLYINATMYRPFFTESPIKKWFTVFEETLDAAGGKPHWAKNFIGSSETATDINRKDSDMLGFKGKIEQWYGDDLKTFQRIRKETDPDGVFLSGIPWARRNGIVEEDEIERVEKLRAEKEEEDEEEEE
ncbi:DEKNAAC103832 [Brettanomyces naardenensis]|uniref:D-arabinono-1,4-lactone oxidase n=1 Tax=Brettanomyces naardenensis TaxID=13370 RepID=A0A448YPH4_BRENA|nr:DEKNAAC103832 [Brettanomyces naardenensis]